MSSGHSLGQNVAIEAALLDFPERDKKNASAPVRLSAKRNPHVAISGTNKKRSILWMIKLPLSYWIVMGGHCCGGPVEWPTAFDLSHSDFFSQDFFWDYLEISFPGVLIDCIILEWAVERRRIWMRYRVSIFQNDFPRHKVNSFFLPYPSYERKKSENNQQIQLYSSMK